MVVMMVVVYCLWLCYVCGYYIWHRDKTLRPKDDLYLYERLVLGLWMTLEGKFIQQDGHNMHHCIPHNILLPLAMITFQYEKMVFHKNFKYSRMTPPFPLSVHFYIYELHIILTENCQLSPGVGFFIGYLNDVRGSQWN